MRCKDKKFDCVDLKNRLQEELQEERTRMGEEETNRRFTAWIENSDDPLAAWWRVVSATHASRAAGA